MDIIAALDGGLSLVAKQEYLEMRQRHDELEKTVLRLEQFDAERQKYELQATAPVRSKWDDY